VGYEQECKNVIDSPGFQMILPAGQSGAIYTPAVDAGQIAARLGIFLN
jgi:hypothetical protein